MKTALREAVIRLLHTRSASVGSCIIQARKISPISVATRNQVGNADSLSDSQYRNLVSM